MPATQVIALLDVGKTNKKLFLFDETYQIVWEETCVLPETADEDGDPCEDLVPTNRWISDALLNLNGAGDLDIRAFNFSAYGASFVYVGQDGTAVTPLYNYLKPYPEKLKNDFYNQYGGELNFSLIAASPVLGSLNSGMQLYRIQKQYPKIYNRIEYALHLPQYLSWLLTGHACSDITSVGCHTNLWNFSQNSHHEWVCREGIIDKLAPMAPSDSVYSLNSRRGFRLPSTVASDAVAGVGLHDSSAAMIPYLQSFQEPFVLISTGTWSISMHPFNAHPLTRAELEHDCLSYMTFRGQAMKSSRLFSGYEHEQQSEKLAAFFQKGKDYYQTVLFNPCTVTALREKTQTAFADYKSIVADSLFAQRDLSAFANFEEAYHRLMMDIIVQQKASTGLILSGQSVKRIFVDGGFGKNPIYMHLLAEAFPNMEVFAATIAQASAIGAAMAIHPHWKEQPLPTNRVILKYYARGTSVLELPSYAMAERRSIN